MDDSELKEIAKAIYENDVYNIKGRLANHELKDIREYIIQLKEEGEIDADTEDN